MLRARSHIEAQKELLSRHPFLALLQASPPLDRVRVFAPQVTFFILGFQDLNRLLAEGARTADLRTLLQRHAAEEVGHERWFLRDLVSLGGEAPAAQVLFGPEHWPTRRATYELSALAIGARDDFERVCLMLTMEATSDVCFGAAEAYFERAGVADRLTFFAGPHLRAEKAHSVFEDEMQSFLASIALDEEQLHRAHDLVHRAYAAMSGMLDGLASTIRAGLPHD